MTTIDLTTLLNMTESEIFDFKSRQYNFYGATDDEKAELLKDILAFANAWKTGDAFIVIGISETDGRKDKAIGIATSLHDNDIQQFVNSKTNRAVRFLVYSDMAEGLQINVVQIARDQQRPIFISKPFGKLKPGDVYIRSGSSTTVASPDQIADMAKADLRTNESQTSLDLEWASPTEHIRLGKETSITCVRLVDSESFEEAANAISSQYATSLGAGLSLNNGPSSEKIIQFLRSRAAVAPLKIWVKNLGLRNASSIKVKIHFPKDGGISVIGQNDLPEKPRGAFDLAFSVHPLSFDTSVRESAQGWDLEIDAKTVQPQDEFWSSDQFYLSSEHDRVMQITARIFADDLSKPIDIPLQVKANVTEREIAAEDLDSWTLSSGLGECCRL
jgi:hypothetical protein